MNFEGRSPLEMALILGTGKKTIFHDHEKLAHYANAAADIEFNFRVQGIRRDTLADFDLKHMKSFQVENYSILMPIKSNFVPYVVEIGIR
jgi:glycyl-tRNA synthetase